MILSHRFRFIFIKTRKTAGTSLELALSTVCGPDDIITPTTDEHIRDEIGGRPPQNCCKGGRQYRHASDFENLLFYNHMSASEIESVVGHAIWHQYFKFCFVRNPWDRAISLYWFGRREPSPPMAEFLAGPMANYLSDHTLYTINDEVAVDYVGRYENIETEIDQIGSRLGFPSQLKLPRAKSEWRSDRRPYREVLSQAEVQVIAKACAKEIELFGYRF